VWRPFGGLVFVYLTRGVRAKTPAAARPAARRYRRLGGLAAFDRRPGKGSGARAAGDRRCRLAAGMAHHGAAYHAPASSVMSKRRCARSWEQ
jgi:hypothetical protein